MSQYRSVDELIGQMQDRLAGQPELAALFARTFPNTLDTTVELLHDGTTFVVTGDIPAMWLRDSSAQVHPYIPLAGRDPALRRVITGLIRRQARYILLDPYANAFNREPNRRGHRKDRPAPGPWVWERKYELDSLCYPVRLVHAYLQASGDTSVCDETVYQMLQQIVATMEIEQQHERDSAYSFERPDPYLPSDTLSHAGRGAPVAGTGMVWSGFRPSDDACAYGYLIPANMFAVVTLGHIVELAGTIYHDPALAERAGRLRDAIDAAIHAHGIVEHPLYGRIYAYETDGMGHYNLMDDANVPSLLSIPYLGYHADAEIYQRTRRFVLSRDNPYYYEGRHARGIGSPHTRPGYVWHMGIIMQGLTATDRAERDDCARMLAATTAGTGLMHESFDPNDPRAFTRPWFAWANSLCAELIQSIVE